MTHACAGCGGTGGFNRHPDRRVEKSYPFLGPCVMCRGTGRCASPDAPLHRVAYRVAGVAEGMGEFVIIDNYEEEAVRTSDVRGALREMVLRQVAKSPGSIIGPEDDVTEENVDEQLDEVFEDGVPDEFDAFLICGPDAEGSEGIAVGFSSADRAAFPMPWPEVLQDEDEFLGNGDPTVYRTTGVPPGTVVKGTLTVLPGDAPPEK